jgi:hypothetical protein
LEAPRHPSPWPWNRVGGPYALLPLVLGTGLEANRKALVTWKFNQKFGLYEKKFVKLGRWRETRDKSANTAKK